MLFLGILVTGLTSFASPAAIAGNSSSGGGFVYEDGINPWFLENTTTVSYCLEVDERNFSLPTERAETIVQEAITSWKNAFKNAPNSFYGPGDLKPFGTVKIATQQFIRESCTDNTELRFQFGVLSKEQKHFYVTQPNRVVAEAIRTHYDRKSLRARGFIYISADSGPLKPDNIDMAKQPWIFSDGIILKRVLLHELGHVFGLSHTGNAYDLMGTAHPEFMVLRSTVARLMKQNKKEVINHLSKIALLGFEFPFESEFCDQQGTIDLGIENIFDQFFGIPSGSKCRKLVFKPDTIEVYASLTKGDQYTLIGRTGSIKPSQSTNVISRIKLPEEQEVFLKLPQSAKSLGYLDGPSARSRSVFNGEYESVDGVRRGWLKATLLPNQMIDLEIVWKNQIVQLMVHGG